MINTSVRGQTAAVFPEQAGQWGLRRYLTFVSPVATCVCIESTGLGTFHSFGVNRDVTNGQAVLNVVTLQSLQSTRNSNGGTFC